MFQPLLLPAPSLPPPAHYQRLCFQRCFALRGAAISESGKGKRRKRRKSEHTESQTVRNENAEVAQHKVNGV